MRNTYPNLLSAVILLAGIRLFSQDIGTNELYPTHDKTIREIPWTTVPGHLGNATPVPSPDMTLTEARTNRESWPAKDFPEGNWGDIQNGFQLSMRFTKPVYTNDERIEAIVLFRNLTNNVPGWEYRKWTGYMDGPAAFHPTPESGGAPLELCIPPDPPISGGMFTFLYPPAPKSGSQDKYVQLLNHGYNFTNGVYRMQAVIEVRRRENATNWVRFQVKCGATTIKIEKP